MAKETSWERLLDEGAVIGDEDTKMKIRINSTFEGSFEQFNTWMNETFKCPENLRLTVIVGSDAEALVSQPLPPPVRSVIHPALQPYTDSGQLTNSDAKVIEILRSRDKIQAIKFLRERTDLGLKDAKDVIEQM